MITLWLILFFLLGAAIGSFLNLVADRLPAGGSIVFPPSHCPECQRKLSAKEVIPIFSYLWLRGRCRRCKASIPVRLLWVELGTAVLFAFLYWKYGLTWELAIVAIYCCLLIVLLVTDLEYNLLPNKILYPGIAIALLIAIAGSIFGFRLEGVSGPSALPWIANAAIGGAIGFVLLFILALVYRGGMGGGDIKLAGFIGLVTAFPLVFLALFLAAVSGGLAAAVLMLTKSKSRKDTIPFGPFLALATMVTLFWGSDFLKWLLSYLAS